MNKRLQLIPWVLVGWPVLALSAAAPDIYGLEPSNTWSYADLSGNSGVAVIRTVTECGNTFLAPPASVCNVETQLPGGILNDWYADVDSELRHFGTTLSSGGHTVTLRFDPPTVDNWDYRSPSENRVVKSTISAAVDSFSLVLRGRTRADMLGKEALDLPFGTVNALKIRYRQRVSGYGRSSTQTSYSWWVPRLGIVKQTGANQRRGSKLASFSIVGDPAEPANKISSDSTDLDNDGLSDWQEVIVTGTDWRVADTDGDLTLDGSDSCPIIPNDQADDDADGTGDACEITATGKVAKGLIIDRPATGADQFSFRLTECTGLADAVFKLNTKNHIHVAVGGHDSGNLKGSRFIRQTRSNRYLLRLRTTGGKLDILLQPNDDALTISGTTADLAIAGESIAAKLEIDGWTCSNESQWKHRTSPNGSARYSLPRS